MPTEPNEGRTTRRKPVFWVTVVAATLAFLYVISGGPAVYVAIKCAPHSIDLQPFYRIYAVVYAPHGWFAVWSESYYNYTIWWAQLANSKIEPLTWEEMKKATRQ
jgi:hypothetical protein